MPSSSTRSTYTELNLLHYFRIAISCLLASYLNNEADFLTDHFSELLDMDRRELMRLLCPKGSPADVKHWDELNLANSRMRLSAKICSAGNALADLGAELFKVGRNKEAAWLCACGSELWKRGVSEHELEQKFQYGKGSRNEPIDLDMEY